MTNDVDAHFDLMDQRHQADIDRLVAHWDHEEERRHRGRYRRLWRSLRGKQ